MHQDIRSLGNIFETVMPILIRENFEQKRFNNSMNYEGFFYYMELENIYVSQIDFQKEIFQAAKLQLDKEQNTINTHV